MPQTKQVLLGRVAKPHGIKGELGVDSHAESPLTFADAAHLTLRLPNGRTRNYDVRSCRAHHGRILLCLKGIDDRNAAELLRNAEIYADSADLPGLDEDEIYLHELENLEVRLPDNSILGHIAGIDTGSGQEIWLIHTPDGHEILFPAADPLIIELDPDAGFAVIDPPPGLLDLYLGQTEQEEPPCPENPSS